MAISMFLYVRPTEEPLRSRARKFARRHGNLPLRTSAVELAKLEFTRFAHSFEGCFCLDVNGLGDEGEADLFLGVGWSLRRF